MQIDSITPDAALPKYPCDYQRQRIGRRRQASLRRRIGPLPGDQDREHRGERSKRFGHARGDAELQGGDQSNSVSFTFLTIS